jgi:hypothetical protein
LLIRVSGMSLLAAGEDDAANIPATIDASVATGPNIVVSPPLFANGRRRTM